MGCGKANQWQEKRSKEKSAGQRGSAKGWESDGKGEEAKGQSWSGSFGPRSSRSYRR